MAFLSCGLRAGWALSPKGEASHRLNSGCQEQPPPDFAPLLHLQGRVDLAFGAAKHVLLSLHLVLFVVGNQMDCEHGVISGSLFLKVQVIRKSAS